jgi:hypothetical protein
MNDRLIDQVYDTYCQDIARIDHLGPNRRLIFTVPHITDVGWEQVVVKLIVPAELLTKLSFMAVGATAQSTPHVLLAADADGWRN